MLSINKQKNSLYFIFVFLCFVSTVSALQSNLLSIVVIDQNGTLIPDVVVRLKNKKGLVKEIKNSNNETFNFSGVSAEKYVLEVEAKGFRSVSQEIEIKPGRNELTIKLEIAEIVENVDVKQNAQDKSLDPQNGAFSNFLTREELDALPDDPRELEKALKDKYGQDAIIKVDGFSGKMPPKSQIASIRVTRSSFDAEYHQLGNTFIDIISKAGSGKWFGTAGFNFNDNRLNARDSFALKRLPAQQNRFDSFLYGPLIKDKTTASILFGGEKSYRQSNINAITPAGQVKGSINNSYGSFSPGIKISQNLSNDRRLNVSYDGSVEASSNEGVGGFDLPERAFSSKTSSHQLRISESGYLGKRFLNEVRLQYTAENLENNPLTNKSAIIVLDAFNSGGAGNKYESHRHNISLSDNLLFGLGKSQALKIGGLFEYEKRSTESEINQNGTFTFSGLNDYISGKPSTFTQSPGVRKVNLAQVQIGAYVQDDIRLRKSLLLSAGMRYEWQNNLNDKNNFSPRLGFTWSPLKTGGLTFRGGAGIYYDWLETNDLALVLSQDITQPSETVIINPDYPNPFSGSASEILPQSYRQLAPKLKNPYIFLSSAGVERQLTKSNSLRILYKFQKGIHQFRSRDINAPLPDIFIRPKPDFGRIVQLESSAFFAQNSLNIDLNGRLNQRLSYSIDYTLAKNVSEADGIFELPSNNYNLRLDRSVSNLDQRHRLFASMYWKIRSGVNLTTNFIVNSPLPYNITTGTDDNGDTVFNDRPLGIARNSVRGAWRKQVDTSLGWTIGFGKRKNNQTGGRMLVVLGEAGGDEVINATHNYSIKLFVTASNLLNQTNFTKFVGVQTSPLFRQAVIADNPRNLSFGLRFNF